MGSRGWVLLETITQKAIVNVTDPSCQQQDHVPYLNIIQFINSMIPLDSNHPTTITHIKYEHNILKCPPLFSENTLSTKS